MQVILIRIFNVTVAAALVYILIDANAVPSELQRVPSIVLGFIVVFAIPFGVEAFHQFVRMLEEIKSADAKIPEELKQFLEMYASDRETDA